MLTKYIILSRKHHSKEKEYYYAQLMDKVDH